MYILVNFQLIYIQCIVLLEAFHCLTIEYGGDATHYISSFKLSLFCCMSLHEWDLNLMKFYLCYVCQSS